VWACGSSRTFGLRPSPRFVASSAHNVSAPLGVDLNHQSPNALLSAVHGTERGTRVLLSGEMQAII
jgi:hypothetical protein